MNSPEISPSIPPPGPLEGDAGAELLPLIYDELRRLAASKMVRESPGQTIQPTELVHEVWLRLGGDAAPQWNNRGHFFAAAAESMRRVLVDRARRKMAVRNGGEFARINAETTVIDRCVVKVENDDELLLISEAIDALAEHDSRKAELVKQRYFVGLTLEESAEVLGVSLRTAKRDWLYARAWLFNEVKRLRA